VCQALSKPRKESWSKDYESITMATSDHQKVGLVFWVIPGNPLGFFIRLMLMRQRCGAMAYGIVT
jgi:hypothetical protein